MTNKKRFYDIETCLPGGGDLLADVEGLTCLGILELAGPGLDPVGLADPGLDPAGLADPFWA
jgi:hypothetical protein